MFVSVTAHKLAGFVVKSPKESRPLGLEFRDFVLGLGTPGSPRGIAGSRTQGPKALNLSRVVLM